MKKKEWQEYHGFTDEDMDLIDFIVVNSNGTITAIFDKKILDNPDKTCII